MTAEELKNQVFSKAEEFGMLTQDMKNNRGLRGTPNAVTRIALDPSSFSNGKAYFGIIRPEESTSGVYYDLSFVVFPQEKGGRCVISIVVGSAGFQRDYQFASNPGVRRSFTRLSENDGYTFIKNDFTDIENAPKDMVDRVSQEEDLRGLEDVVKYYAKVLLASRIVDPDKEFDVISAWLAQYAVLREWGRTKQAKTQQEAINNCAKAKTVDIQEDIKGLLANRRFVVLQGAPGTGKTYNALKISAEYDKTVFIQFHAETNYSDFVEGILPTLDGSDLRYIQTKGKLIEAIEEAEKIKNYQAPKNGRVLLIIDEINRANLSNVLGPVFYLFENQVGARDVKLKIAGKEISKLPDNLDVIATMNTADRSLSVVDFALRRRFAWYTIRPQEISPDAGHIFHKALFNKFCCIFDMYATDAELNLQPGPSYFLTPKENANDIMKQRMIYELMPLVKEYLAEGLMRKASDRFAQLFFEETKMYLYE